MIGVIWNLMPTDQITHRFVETNGIRMHCAEAGAGRIVTRASRGWCFWARNGSSAFIVGLNSKFAPAELWLWIAYDRKGSFLRSWGEGDFTYRTHGITAAPDGTVWCTDDGNHTVRRFTPEGKLLAADDDRGGL